MIDGDPDLGQDAINQKRDWLASEGRAVFPAQVVHGCHRDRHDLLSLRQSSCKRLSAAGGFLIGDRVDDLEVLRGTQWGELLRPVRKDISGLHEGEFLQMAEVEISLMPLLDVRERLIFEINKALTDDQSGS